MPKICDPPQFTGGQCQGVFYNVLWRLTTREVSFGFVNGKFGAFPNGLENVSTGTTNFRGQLIRVSPPIQLISNTVRPDPNDPYYGSFEGTILRGNGQVTQFARYFESAKLEILSVTREDGLPDNCGDTPSLNCRCSPDSCRIDCEGEPDGFCCIDHAFTDSLIDILEG